jgi:hypothetical protein
MTDRDIKLKQYFRLCTVTEGREHIVHQIVDKVGPIINKKDQNTYFRLQNGYLVPKETVIGGNKPSSNKSSQIVMI